MDFTLHKKKDVMHLICLSAITFVTFSMSAHYPFLKSFDDNVYVLCNKHLDFTIANIVYWLTHSCAGCYLPFTMFSYMFDYSLWGLNSFGYHLQNIFWHIVAAIAVYKCFRLFSIKSWIAFLLCLIFAVHPQRVESVVWISERKDVLCAAFYFLSILFYIKEKKRIAFIFFILSIFSKPTAVSLPLILLLYEFYKQKNCGIKCYFSKLWLYFLILAIFIPISIIAQEGAAHSHDQILSFQRLYIVLCNVYWYFTQIVFPIELNPVYPRQIYFTGLIALILFYAGSILIITVILKRNRRFFIYSVLPLLLAFIVSLLPIIGIVRLGSIDHADRYSYIPSVFVWFSFGLVLTGFLYNEKYDVYKNVIKRNTTFLLSSKFIFSVLFLYSVVLIILNVQYQKNWKNNCSLFSYAANTPSPNSNVLIVLATSELKKGNYKEVLTIANKLKEKNKGSFIAAYFEASVMYHLDLDKRSAIKLLLYAKPVFKPASKYSQVLDWDFRYVRTLIMLIDLYYSIGDKNRAIRYIDELLQCKEISIFAQYSFKGMKAECQSNNKKATYYYKKALKVKPDDKDIEKKLKDILNYKNRL